MTLIEILARHPVHGRQAIVKDARYAPMWIGRLRAQGWTIVGVRSV